MSALSLLSLCRFCAKEQTQTSVIDLKQSNKQRRSVELKLGIFNEEIVEFSNTNLPNTVCTECFSSLNTCYDFFIQVKESQVVLNKVCEIIVKADQPDVAAVPGKLDYDDLGHESDSSIDIDVKPAIPELSWSSYPWRCLHCSKILASMQELRAHSQAKHNMCYGFCCDDCDERMDQFEEFVMHVRCHRPYLENMCQYCNTKMETPRHTNTHTNYKCSHCGELFSREIYLKTHLKKYSKFKIKRKKKRTRTFSMDIEIADEKTDDIFENDIKPIIDDNDSGVINTDITNSMLQQNNTIDATDDMLQEYSTTLNNTYPDNNMSEQNNDSYKTDDSIFDTSFQFNTYPDDGELLHQRNMVIQQNYVKDEMVHTYTKIDSWSEYPCVCRFCNRKMKSRQTLQLHCTRLHKKCFAMRCVDCDHDVSTTYESFVLHVKEHQPHLANMCHYCDAPLTDPEHLMSHMGHIHCTECDIRFRTFREFNGYHGVMAPYLKQEKKVKIGKVILKTRYICDFCSKIMMTKISLAQHIKKQHEGQQNNIPNKKQRKKKPIQDFVCKICHKLLKSQNSLNYHSLIHTKRTKDYTCDRCGKTFYTKSAMDAHFALHDATRKEMCKICGKYFLTITHLKKHVRSHNLEKPYQCDHCKKFFNSKENLRSHIVVHMDIKRYKCRFCDKRFKSGHTLRDHLRLHTGDRPYSCEACSKFFACWSSCEQHMRRIHGKSLRMTVQTPQGRLALDPATGQPSQLSMSAEVEEWTRKMLKPLPRRRNVELDKINEPQV